MTRLFTNNASTTLSSGASPSDTSLSLASGSSFPTPASPDYFVVTLTQGSGTETSWEDVKVTARSGNTLTCDPVVGTWASGSKVEIRWNADAALDAANVAQAGTAILDFGDAPGGNLATVVVTGQADIKSSSFADCYVPMAASADHTDLDHLIAQITVKCGDIVAGTGFTIYGYSPLRLTGRYNVNWIRTM